MAPVHHRSGSTGRLPGETSSFNGVATDRY
jgi:hypothetical protein